MTTQVLHPLAAEYLDRLRTAAKRLPRGRRDELIADIEVHLAEAVAPDAGDAEALTVLDRLGTPEEIVAAELPETSGPVDARGVHEWTAIFLLLFGGFFFGVGWIIGLIALWSSRCWNTWEKLLGTLVVPGGWATMFFALVTTASTGHQSTGRQILGVALFAFFVLGPPFTAVFLAIRAKTPPSLRHPS
jgi:hypothetical protein